MAVNRRWKLIILLIVLAAIAAAVYLMLHKKEAIPLQPDDIRFVEVFTEMALARQAAGDNYDYLDSLYSVIYKKYDVDSTWLFDYASKASNDAEKEKKIWDLIVGKIDSLKTVADSGMNQQSESSSNADSI
jgi:hypothetical protein